MTATGPIHPQGMLSVAALVGLLLVAAPKPAQSEEFPMIKVAPKIALKARPFHLQNVRLLDGPFLDATQRTRKYLHALESDRLLHFFHVQAGLKPKAKPMGGWESTELRGHTMGHYLSACAMMYASTGDEKLKAKADAIVAELARCQRANRGGYLSAFPTSFITRALARKNVWAPFYTLHKIFAGLMDMYVYCDSTRALEVACGLAGWIEKRIAKLSADEMQAVLNKTEQGGMNDALANLYGLTGEARWLALSRRFVQKRYVQPLSRGEDRLKGEHVNSFIPNIIGTARQYELTGDKTDRRIVEYFWKQVTSARCYCTGGTSNGEHWRSDPHKLADQLGDHTQETCCTYNMLKLTRHVFTWTARPDLADYHERALFNSILSTQDPATGMMMYFVTLAPGRWKYFNTPRDSFWCCTGTGMENHAKYADSIYFHDDDGVWVNLFIASELTWRAQGVRIRQETRFPRQEGTALTVRADQPAEFTVRLRIPAWAAGGVTVKLNGKRRKTPAKPGSYARLRRTWRDGDKIELALPMALRAEPMPDDKTRVALMYGPLVLAGQLGGKGLTDKLTYTTQNWYRFPRKQIASAPVLVTGESDVSRWVRPVAGKPLTFRTVGVGRPNDVTLVPYHRLWGQRYAVYWRVLTESQFKRREVDRKAREAAEKARRESIRRRRVDEVAIGDAQSERSHKLKHQGSSAGVHRDRHWRHALGGGWFSYDLKVLPATPMALQCTYWGSDADNRVFDILVDGQKIATQKLQADKPDEFFDVEYAVPAGLTQGKKTVTVTFRARRGATAGGVFGCRMLKRNGG